MQEPMGVDQRDIAVVAEQADHLLPFVLAQEAVDRRALADMCEAPPVPRQGHARPQAVLLPPAKVPGLTLGEVWAARPGAVAAPKIAFTLTVVQQDGP